MLLCPCVYRKYRAILLAIFNLGSARSCHVRRVRSRACALSALKLAAPITPWVCCKGGKVTLCL
ncbi:hypothetical protein C5975_06820 [Cronobacter sakazakii]|nr:hypothetical protein C5975_06820 [Cronobacter sakazakii]PQY55992.1 hypothetical protein C5954_16470 [Cronobacter sakazakii]PUV51274.1 hypothetical protein CDT88_17310 [Cronobacter sakazakii]